jgi:hypothetical protein
MQVLARGVPKDDTQSVGLRIQEFFRENHEQGYATHQVCGFTSLPSTCCCINCCRITFKTLVTNIESNFISL